MPYDEKLDIIIYLFSIFVYKNLRTPPLTEDNMTATAGWKQTQA